jgi:predicted phosphoribosyltransferase
LLQKAFWILSLKLISDECIIFEGEGLRVVNNRKEATPGTRRMGIRAWVVEDHALRDRTGVFQDRFEAGELLAQALEEFRGEDAIVLATPSGGVPVGLKVAEALGLAFDLIIIRKIPVPDEPESGFGAVSLEGDLILNSEMVRALHLSPEDIENRSKPVMEELKIRNRLFRGSRPWPELNKKTVILVDDGLASGYTMRAAASMVKRRGPAQVVVAVPTAPKRTVEMLREHVDGIFCLNVRAGAYFAVAEAYKRWYDLSQEEVVDLLSRYNLPDYGKDKRY